MTPLDRLPNLIIAGVSKAGTTSLFAYLSQHPGICPSRVKELHFFSPLRYGKPLQKTAEDYAANFDHWDGEPYRMEATPNYFFGGPPLIGKMQEFLTDPRIIVTLRNPVDRMWSGYAMKRRKGRLGPSVSFEQYVEECVQVAEGRPGRHGDDGLHLSLRTGIYADYTQDWIEAFGDRVRFIFFEQWTAHPAASVSAICSWLGIDSGVADQFDYRVRNRAALHRSRRIWRMAAALNRASHLRLLRHQRLKGLLTSAYRSLNTVQFPEKPDAGTRRRLEEFYREHNSRLGAQLKNLGYEDLPDWVSPSRVDLPAFEKIHQNAGSYSQSKDSPSNS